MGVNLCKSQAVYEDGLTQIDIPELNPKIQKHLLQKKPFQKELKSQKQIVMRKYPSGVYCGPLNIYDNPSGYGKFYYNDGSLYVGEFKNGKGKGQAILLRQDGTFMSGKIDQNQITKGTLNCQNYIYNGQFKKNIFHGKGQFKSKLHNYQFVGTFQNGKKTEGKLHWTSDNCIYTFNGKFNSNQQCQGEGQLQQQPIGVYKGSFKQGLKHGKGCYQYSNGLKYIGQYQKGLKSGKGILYNGDDNSQAYNGQFLNGLPHGKGKALGKQSKIVETNWIEGINQSQFQK